MDLVNHLEGRLLFAVPKKGRLLQAALNLLEGADIQFRRENRLDIALVKNLPIALIFLPAADIPTFVGEGRVSLGITGRDTVAEHEAGVIALRKEQAESGKSTPQEDEGGCVEVMDLGFGSCKLQVQVPEKGQYGKPSDLIGKNIGTSFVHLAEEYFAALEAEADAANGTKSKKLKTKIIELSGSVEAACALGVADGIVDLVESGETMKAAGLKPIDTVVSSTAVLIKSKNPTNVDTVELVAARIRGVITAQKHVLCQYNVERTKLAAATKITPGKRAPTVNALEGDGAWVAVSSMVEKKKIATVMDELTEVGAQDILVLEIANTR
ncbi:ATP phosphoribosyltransferase [Hyaloscypha finlandica]|nr:ATP phosphoribosyltransferase [Hyaloscypha finlandica]KAH8776800.1 ATP phosphoribosyltransferase [Hyaloscypha sp. PMI_1271]